MSENELPNDINELKRIVVNLDQQNSQLVTENSQLKDTILYLQRKKFAPQSERYIDQLPLFNELEEIIEEDSSPDDDEEVKVPGHTRKRGKRKTLPDSLERKDDIYDLSEEEKVGMKCIGEEITEKLEFIPGKVFVRRIIRKKYAPVDDENGKIIIATAPQQLLPKTMAGTSLIAQIITAKYVDSLPLYRQEKIFSRISAELTRQTMARWLIKVSEAMIPLYNLLQDLALERSYILMDETRVQVLKENGKKATSKSYMWVRFSPGDEKLILYDYSASRSGDVPLELLEGFSGILQCDGYDGYAPICRQNKLIRVGCWDHCRRKFNDAFKSSNGKGIGKKALDFIKKLYKIEREIEDLPPDKKKEIRQEKSKPIIDKLKEWIDEKRSKTTPGSLAGKALNYAFNEWTYLIEYLNDGRIHISNSFVENAIRPFCIGRKNWLFSDSVAGAKASAMFYSIIETAKANGLEPFDYLNRMLDKLPTAETIEDYQRLLPLNGKFLA